MKAKTFRETLNESKGDSKLFNDLDFKISPKLKFKLSAKYIDGAAGNWSVKDNEDGIVLNGYLDNKNPKIEYSSAKILYFKDELFAEVKKQIKKWL